MSEEDVRGGLRDAVAGEPPLDFDPDTLMASARQQVTRRRSLMAAGIATIAVAVVAVAVPVVLGRDQGSSTATQVVEHPDTYTTEQLRARGVEMRERLRQVVPEVLTGATTFEFGEFGGEAEGHFYEGQNAVNTHVSFTLDGRRYSLAIDVRAPGADPPWGCGDEMYCEDLAARSEGRLMSATTDVGNGGTILMVFHYRQSGTVVSVAAYNYDMASRTPPVFQPTIPVSRDQLSTLATDPGLSL